jgi:hypothetical protein
MPHTLTQVWREKPEFLDGKSSGSNFTPASVSRSMSAVEKNPGTGNGISGNFAPKPRSDTMTATRYAHTSLESMWPSAPEPRTRAFSIKDRCD